MKKLEFVATHTHTRCVVMIAMLCHCETHTDTDTNTDTLIRIDFRCVKCETNLYAVSHFESRQPSK